MIVLDASAALELLLSTERGQVVAERVFAPGATLHAPELLNLEVIQVLRRYERDGDLGARRARQALDDLEDLGVERYAHRVVVPRVWERRANLTAYDAAYVALAELLELPLLTCDARLARAPHTAVVEVV